MLTYRLNLLYNIVDYFVIVEARQTFVGTSKTLYFDENKHLFEQFSDKIIHIIVDMPFTKENIKVLNLKLILYNFDNFFSKFYFIFFTDILLICEYDYFEF